MEKGQVMFGLENKEYLLGEEWEIPAFCLINLRRGHRICILDLLLFRVDQRWLISHLSLPSVSDLVYFWFTI